VSDSDKSSTQPGVKFSIAQKIGIFFLIPVFTLAGGIIIYDQKLADPGIIAATGFVIIMFFWCSLFIYQEIGKEAVRCVPQDATNGHHR
jgi:hypothetical protein